MINDSTNRAIFVHLDKNDVLYGIKRKEFPSISFFIFLIF